MCQGAASVEGEQFVVAAAVAGYFIVRQSMVRGGATSGSADADRGVRRGASEKVLTRDSMSELTLKKRAIT